MSLKDAIDIFCGGNRDKSGGLFYLVIDETRVGKGRLVFAGKSKTFSNDIIDSLGNGFIRASRWRLVHAKSGRHKVSHHSSCGNSTFRLV